MSELITRKVYLGALQDPTMHHRYHMQFVNQNVLRLVADNIGTARLLSASDQQAFNDIPLPLWDGMERTLRFMVSRETLKAAGQTWSMGISGCILKAAARHIVEQAKK